ncbi:unnamed protein product [Boreogadus saida]
MLGSCFQGTLHWIEEAEEEEGGVEGRKRMGRERIGEGEGGNRRGNEGSRREDKRGREINGVERGERCVHGVKSE